ncbi:hypothetical protein EZS27_036485 [termite gut metagenome]|uniref:Uncharacterized protein n=1 Tax=termite gut metagenome TaxID=433724 RepID=A0A5J4PU10_9ZZZZ
MLFPIFIYLAQAILYITLPVVQAHHQTPVFLSLKMLVLYSRIILLEKGILSELVKCVLPSELIDYFELLDIKKEGAILHFHLDELPVIPSEYSHLNLSGNGFYASSTLKDFPLRDKKVLLHVWRRHWVDESGKVIPVVGI